MKLRFRLLIVIFALFITGANAWAQVPDSCLECPDSAAWEMEIDTVALYDCPGCDVELKWRWRGGYPWYDPPKCYGIPIYEMEILSFRKLDG